MRNRSKWMWCDTLIVVCLALGGTSSQASPVDRARAAIGSVGSIWRSYYNPFAPFSNKVVGVRSILRRDFYASDDRGAVVGICTHDSDNLMRAQVDFSRDRLAGRERADGRTVFSHRANHPDEFFGALLEVHAVSGPIQRLAIVAHGSPGAIYFGDDPLDVDFVLANAAALEALPDDLFAADAEIAVLSCQFTAGTRANPDRGIDRARFIFASFVRRGARITASRQVVQPSGDALFDRCDGQLTAPKVNAAYACLVLAPVALFALYPTTVVTNVINSIIRDRKTKQDPIDVITIRPR